MLGHNEKACVQKEKDIRMGNIKKDQFGTWLRAESYGFSSENIRRQGGNNNNERNTWVRNDIVKRAEKKRDVGTSRNLLNLEEGADSTDSQYGKGKDDTMGVGQQDSRGIGRE